MRVLTAHQGKEDSRSDAATHPEQIILKLREAERLQAEGHKIPEVAKHLETSEATTIGGGLSLDPPSFGSLGSWWWW